MLENMPEVEIEVPHFVKVYCQNRTTEYTKYLDPIQLKKAFHNKDLKVKVLDKIDTLIRCHITQVVKPLTVLKNPMLMYAAELEYRTWKVEFPITLQEARWKLIDSYPQTNNIAQPDSCLILIQERKGACKLSISEIVELATERRIARRKKEERLCYA
jgi:hypothetical protein